MMRRRRHARLSPATGAAGGDTEALQTDVMRFMSIIGLCLMAVFALVQGIPVQEQGKPAQPSQVAGIRQEIRAQQQQLLELRAEVEALQSEKVRTQQVLTVTYQHLEQGRRVLAGIEQDSMREKQDLAELRARLQDSQLQLDHSHKEIEALKYPPRRKTVKPVIENRPLSAPSAKPDPARQGFILRFASTAALDRLVAAGSVTLYGMADQQAWRLSMDAGRPAVTQTPFPGWFHEMSAVTVPAHYLYSLKKAADGPGQSNVVWGVQLPAATKVAIASLSKGQQGGALVIQDDGQVTLEE